MRNAGAPSPLYRHPLQYKIAVASVAVAKRKDRQTQLDAARSSMTLSRSSSVPESDASRSMQFDVTMAADVAAISPVVSWVMRMVGELDYAAGKEFEIEMALREALANAILHGCKCDPTMKIECSVKGDRNEGIQIVVRDPGKGFDPKSIPSPTDDSNLHADHGRGILLISKLMDEVTHESNGTVIRMRKF